MKVFFFCFAVLFVFLFSFFNYISQFLPLDTGAKFSSNFNTALLPQLQWVLGGGADLVQDFDLVSIFCPWKEVENGDIENEQHVRSSLPAHPAVMALDFFWHLWTNFGLAPCFSSERLALLASKLLALWSVWHEECFKTGSWKVQIFPPTMGMEY